MEVLRFKCSGGQLSELFTHKVLNNWEGNEEVNGPDNVLVNAEVYSQVEHESNLWIEPKCG